MKYKVTKTISLTMVLILLLGVFASCSNALNGDKETTPSVNAGANPDDLSSDNNEEKEDDPTRVFTLDSLEPLSKEKQKEVEAAWLEYAGEPLLWRSRVTEKVFITERYYGTYNNCVVFFMSSAVLTGTKTIEIAGHEIHFNYRFNIWVYNDGQFYKIEEAYEKGLLDESNIARISKYHSEFQMYVHDVTHD